jgi:hypothetical protein
MLSVVESSHEVLCVKSLLAHPTIERGIRLPVEVDTGGRYPVNVFAVWTSLQRTYVNLQMRSTWISKLTECFNSHLFA